MDHTMMDTVIHDMIAEEDINNNKEVDVVSFMDNTQRKSSIRDFDIDSEELEIVH